MYYKDLKNYEEYLLISIIIKTPFSNIKVIKSRVKKIKIQL